MTVAAAARAHDLPRCYYQGDPSGFCQKAVDIILSHPHLSEEEVARLIKRAEDMEPGFFDQPWWAIAMELIQSAPLIGIILFVPAALFFEGFRRMREKRRSQGSRS